MLSRLFKLIVSVLFYVGFRILLTIYSIVEKQFMGTLVILTYHSVKDVQRHIFERHMDELLKLGRAVSTDINKNIIKGYHHLAVTFDDGFQSVINNALPTLRDRGIPAKIFVTTGYLGKRPGWISNYDNENANEILLSEE